MESGDGYLIAHRDELERSGRWSLVRKSLDIRSFGVNVVELEPGYSIPEHDETLRDQEELFFALRGSGTIVIDGSDHPFPAGSLARLDVERKRTVRNDGDEPLELLIVSAPRTSGFEPDTWN